MATLSFGTAKAGRGHKAWGTLRVREGKKQVRLPVAVVNGQGDGEHVVVLANQHGGEVNGVEAIRLFVEQVDPRKMKGSVFLVPSANPRAAMMANEFYPEDADAEEIARYQGGRYREPGYDRNECPYNMNRRWPGEKGSGLIVDRVVHEIWTRAVIAPHRKASLLLDIHCHQSPSAIYSAFREDVAVGVASGCRHVIFTRSAYKPPHRRYSRIACWNAGIQSLTVELGRQAVVDPVSVEDGRRIILNLLKFWGMAPGKVEYYPEPTLILDPWRNDVVDRKFARPSSCAYKARHRGLVVERKAGYDLVRQGELISHIVDPFSGRVVEECRAPMSGAVLTPCRGLAACERGDRVFSVSSCRKVDPVQYVKRLSPDDYRGPDAVWHTE